MLTINDLYKLNVLKEKFLLVEIYEKENSKIDVNWLNIDLQHLINAQNEIDQEYEKIKNKYKFQIILNCKFLVDDKNTFILELANGSVEEFSNYIEFIPYVGLTKRKKEKLNKQFEKFKNLKSDYLKLQFFKKICR